MLAAVGLGWTILPDTLVGDELHRLPVRSLQLSRKLGLVRHTERTPSNAAGAMRELLLGEREKRRDAPERTKS